MKALVLGATGLVGSHALRALRAAGCTTTGASRHRPQDEHPDDWIEIDFGRMTSEDDWLPLLAGVDAVVNCVGILREEQAGDFDLLHRAAPVALFGACERLGVRRVVQLSALGSHPDAVTAYWCSKGAADADLLARTLSATIVRPSLVYGEDGASSVLFRALATLPLLMLPMAHEAKVQPIHIDDLAALIARLAMAGGEAPHEMAAIGEAPRELAAVGPRAMTLAGYLGALRGGMRSAPSLVLDLSMPLARMAARVAARMPSSALTPDSLRMLEQSADGGNTADAAPVVAMLGRPLRDPARFARPAQRIGAVWSWAAPLITMTVALLWLITAWVSWFGWPHAQSMSWLAACGVPAGLREPMLLAASFMDAAVGALLLLRPRRWLWAAQLALAGGYTVIMSVCLPEFWLHPFGPLSKNLPLLALMLLMWRVSK
ncbi:SDR family oxidoreductase [Duganella sp. BJB1802]|uniref:SDR family oxidoreductase n=1 Tax=Duganella sp. BJB1802 TaxID=2744575 RepID=UPI00159358A6|nr:SDR family oxidoreductase [Duganella sp. BJB1802]NVD72040.1 SDR family oxidoreductase [Duganella sp. BJB1802]